MTGHWKFSSIAELKDWLEEPSRFLPRDLNPIIWPEIVTAGTHSFRILPGSLLNDGEAQGFCFSSPGLIQQLWKAHQQLGENLCLETDGTYKLHHGNWVLCPVGTHTTRQYSKHDKCQAPVHTFVPFAYMMTKTESSVSYRRLFASLKDVAERALGITLKVST